MATARPASVDVTLEVTDLDSVALGPDTYDFAFSSLAVHYVKDLKALIAKVYSALKPGGHFFFSTEHPIYTAPLRREACQHPDDESAHWPLSQYFEEGPRTHFWFVKDVEKNHWTTDTYINALLAASFELVYFHEWGRPGDGKFGGSSWWMTADIGPTFLMLGGRKRKI
jgi:SAM-dependent methyltransferase